MVKTNGNFKLSKTTKRSMAMMKGTDADRNHYKRMMIEAEHAASIPVRLPKSRNEAPKG
jgi:hypothetical protein